MLRKEHDHYEPGLVIVMSDMDILTATMKTTLRDIAKQATALGTGLQNAAPGDKTEKPNKSVQYLLSVAEELEKKAEECEALLADISKPTQQKL